MPEDGPARGKRIRVKGRDLFRFVCRWRTPSIFTMLTDYPENIGYADDTCQGLGCKAHRPGASSIRPHNDLPTPVGKDYAFGKAFGFFALLGITPERK